MWNVGMDLLKRKKDETTKKYGFSTVDDVSLECFEDKFSK